MQPKITHTFVTLPCRRLGAILASLLFWSTLATAEHFTGKVIEQGQPFTQRAKQFVSDLCYHKEVKVETKGQDRYQRTIAEVILPDGRILNYEIVKVGFAWWFKRYAPNDATLENSKPKKQSVDLGFYVIQYHRGNSEGTSQQPAGRRNGARRHLSDARPS